MLDRTRNRWLPWLVTLTLGAGVGALIAPRALAATCASDNDCSDGLFCNGVERCRPGAAGADARGCLRSTTPACAVNLRCDEGSNRCVTPCQDSDGDGHRAISCGGDDCDDRDSARFPGNIEVCDAEGHDEDCDPTTYGHRDNDKDGEDDIRCCNRDGAGTLYCGVDYDDSNSAVRVGSQICDGADAVVVSGSYSKPCPTGTKCIAQPNGTGVCALPPPGYTAPPKFSPPPPPAARQALPSLGTLKKGPVPSVPTVPK